MNLTQLEYETCVSLAQNVYSKSRKNLLPQHEIETFSGLRARIFEFNNVEYVAICGTNSLRDWISNFKIFIGITPRQHKRCLEFINKELCKDKKLILTTHSLGGSIGQYCIVHIEHDNAVCVNFNPAGIRHILNPKKNKFYEDNIFNIVTHRDILARLTSILPFNWMKNVGKTLIIQDDESWNGVKSHSNWNIFKKFKL